MSAGPMPGPRALVAGVGHAVPAAADQGELWDGYFARHYAGNPLARRIWESSGIATRHGVVDPREEDVSRWGTAQRMQRYLVEAMPLGKEAVGSALASAGLAAGDVGLFAVCSCTGYVSPGLDILLARDLGLPDSVQRVVIGHMGCYAALPGLGVAADFVRSRSLPAVLLCVELTSLHVQPPAPPGSRSAEEELQQVVAHALFADAAAAVVLLPTGAPSAVSPRPGAPSAAPLPDSPAALAVADVEVLADLSASDQMTWDVTDLGFKMGLSPRVPDVLARHVCAVVGALLARHGLAVADVAGWVVHPGGRRILEVVAAELQLPDGALAASYNVLRDYGNCSSATVLLVLEHLLGGSAADSANPAPTGPLSGPVVLMAFGPGLTLYTVLLAPA